MATTTTQLETTTTTTQLETTTTTDEAAERDAYWMVSFEQIDAGAVGCALPSYDDFDDDDDAGEDW